MIIGNKEFRNDYTYIMGILNVTPDSFSDGGNFNTVDSALLRTEKMIKDGAHIIDIGGESTRPGHTKISDDEEIARVLPVIDAIKARFDIPISVDTYKSTVAREAINAGADLINDIWGLKYDSNIAEIVAKSAKSICIMHNRENVVYNNLIPDVIADLKEGIKIAKNAGIGDDKIIIDPGIGFAKSYENNLALINRLDTLHILGYPLLLGSSRKSVIGIALDLPVEDRLEGTLATTAIACMKGAMFVRVHDILENNRLITMINKIKAEH